MSGDRPRLAVCIWGVGIFEDEVGRIIEFYVIVF